MSCHFTYGRLYEVIRDGKLFEVADALFFIGKENIRTTILCQNATALELACQFNHKTLVDFLLHSLYETLKDRKEQAKDLLRVACSKNNHKMAKHLLGKYKLDPELTDSEIEYIIRKGYYKIMRLYFDSPRNRRQVDKWLARILDFAFVNGNIHIEDLGEEVLRNDIYVKWMESFHPVFRAVFTCNMKILDREIQWRGSKWCKGSVSRLGKSCDVFCFAAGIGDTALFADVVKRARLFEADMPDVLEPCCTAACYRGSAEILKCLFEGGYLRTRTFNDIWRKRYDYAECFGHTEVMMYIFEKFRSEMQNRSLSPLLNWLIERDDIKSLKKLFKIDNEHAMRSLLRMNGRSCAKKSRLSPRLLTFFLGICPVDQYANLIEGIALEAVVVEKLLEVFDREKLYHKSLDTYYHRFSHVVRSLTNYWREINVWMNHCIEFPLDSQNLHLLDYVPHEPKFRLTLTSVDDLETLLKGLEYLAGTNIRCTGLRTILEVGSRFSVLPKLRRNSDESSHEFMELVGEKVFECGIQINGSNGSGSGGVGQMASLKCLTRRAVRVAVRKSGVAMGNRDRVLALETRLPRSQVQYLLFNDGN